MTTGRHAPRRLTGFFFDRALKMRKAFHMKFRTSASRNILTLLGTHAKTFSQNFPAYLDATDEMIRLQEEIGLDPASLQALPAHDRKLIKAYLFLVESSNTTWAAALHLLSAGFISDAYGLIRILYETASLLHYGNSSPPETRNELYKTMFKSGLPGKEHKRQEWALTQKATRALEADNPQLISMRQEMNNFGGHISLSKIALSNVTTMDNACASRIFAPNWSHKRYLLGLDLLFSTNAFILIEYAKFQENYGGVPAQVATQINELPKNFESKVRPQLEARMEKGSPLA